MPRAEDRRLLSGTGRFVDDHVLPGMLHATFVRSPIARGNLIGVDVAAARRLAGVSCVLTAEDLNHVPRQWWAGLAGPPSDAVPYPPRRALADVDVRYLGEPVALVLASNRYVAEDAAGLVDVEIEPMPPVVGIAAALHDDAPLVHPETGSNVAKTIEAADPRVDEIFATAAHVVERHFSESRASHTPMETRGIIASWDSASGQMEIWASTQNVYEVRSFCARLLGLSEHDVNVNFRDVGGGFGQKVNVGREEACIMLAAHHAGRAVKWIEDRWENLVTAGQGRSDEMTLSIALDAQGNFLALRGHLLEDVGSGPNSGTGSSAGLVRMMLPGPYRVPKVSYRAQAVYTNSSGRVAYRGPWLMETLAREQLIDEAAAVIGVDPLVLRRQNVVRSEDQPYVTATGQHYNGITPAECLDAAAAAVDYDTFRERQAAARREGELLGIGIGLYVEPSGIAAGGSMSSEAATVRIDRSGTVTVSTGAASCGNSTETTLAQIAADELGCDLSDIRVVQGDTRTTPFGNGMGGSRNAPIYGGAVLVASEHLGDKVRAIAAHLLEAAPEDIVLRDSVASVLGTPSRRVPLREIAILAYDDPRRMPPEMELGLESSHRYRPPTPYTWSNACHICTCSIDQHTGRVTLTGYVVAEDCGRIINPSVVRGQILGGVTQGIGGALFEHLQYDRDGNPLSTTFLDYLLPTVADVIDVDIVHIETPAQGAGGFRGMGEGGAIGAPAAVANAVADALAGTGLHRALPFRPEDVWQALPANNHNVDYRFTER